MRPERVDVLNAGDTRENQFDATLKERAFLGSQTRYLVDALGQELMVKRIERESEPALEPGARLSIGWRAIDAQLLAVEPDQ